jgi:hypothetical protein
MTKHSKNNTASSIFSYAEYKRLDYGTKRVNLFLLVENGTSNCFAATIGKRVHETV